VHDGAALAPRAAVAEVRRALTARQLALVQDQAALSEMVR
jgi:hypothetical protein